MTGTRQDIVRCIAGVHSQWAVTPAMLEAATDEEH